MRYALIYGGMGGAIAIGLISAILVMGLTGHDETAMLVSYLIMLVALSLIFVGVKRYRDVECGGVIRFGRAFALGLGMAAVAGLIYAVGWEIFVSVSGYDFMADYSASQVEALRAQGAAPAAIEAKAAEMRAFAETYRNPLFRIPMIFVEIFPVGLLVALVSAALLRNPRLLPARG
ncbi:MAG TPA: DUF4199 domain-containing protein [Allosphingosinicella sp.]|jgi:hypothetical protein|nr:DUF4199 domain-containing protein [Allosphingosinicella sp.]